MSAEKISERPLLLTEVLDLLEKRREGKKKFDRASHERLYEYAQKFTKLPQEKAKLLLKKLLEIRVRVGDKELRVPEEVAVDIVNVVPKNRDELEPFLAYLEFKEKIMLLPKIKEEFAQKILDVIKEVIG